MRPALCKKMLHFAFFIMLEGLAACALTRAKPPCPPHPGTALYPVRIESTPAQAAIILDREGCVVDREGRESCVDRECCVLGYTPWEGKLARGAVSVTLEKEGFEPAKRSYKVRRTRRVQLILFLLDKIHDPPKGE